MKERMDIMRRRWNERDRGGAMRRRWSDREE